MRKIKRRKFFVKKGMQVRYMSLVIFPLLVLLTALYYVMYYFIMNEMLIPEAIATILIPAMRKVNVTISLTLPIILLLLLRTSLVYSNRVIGPIPRLERELNKAIKGDFSVRLKARSTDELDGFVKKVNMLLERVGRECS